MVHNRVVWCASWRWPYHYGFCPSEAAWLHMVKFMKLNPTPYPISKATTNFFLNRETKVPVAVVCVMGNTPQNIVELMAHEAMHVWRDLRKTIGEKKPSSEFEAYALQTILGELLDAYQKTRGPLFLKSSLRSPSK